jgi:osmotically-inducible protein OsmY
MADDRNRDYDRFGRPRHGRDRNVWEEDRRDRGYGGNPGGDAVYGSDGVQGGYGSGGASDTGRESEWNRGGRERDRGRRHEHPRWSSDDDRGHGAYDERESYRRREPDYRDRAGYSYGSRSETGPSGYGASGPRDDEGGRGWFEQAGDEVASWFGDEDAARRRQADQHRGRGPKGYQRSDERILEDVNDRLTDDPFIDATDIEVSVSGGEVTLSGSVSDRQAKRRAEDIADTVSGVGHVQNNMRVQGRCSPGAGPRDIGTDQPPPMAGATRGPKVGKGGTRDDA